MVQDTSVLAYNDILSTGLLNEQEQEVFRAFLVQGPSTDKEISHKSSIDINIVTGRRNNLIDKGYMQDNGTRLCGISGRMVHFWSVCSPGDINPVNDVVVDSLLNKDMKKIFKMVRLANDYQKAKIIRWCNGDLNE